MLWSQKRWWNIPKVEHKKQNYVLQPSSSSVQDEVRHSIVTRQPKCKQRRLKHCFWSRNTRRTHLNLCENKRTFVVCRIIKCVFQVLLRETRFRLLRKNLPPQIIQWSHWPGAKSKHSPGAAKHRGKNLSSFGDPVKHFGHNFVSAQHRHGEVKPVLLWQNHQKQLSEFFIIVFYSVYLRFEFSNLAVYCVAIHNW